MERRYLGTGINYDEDLDSELLLEEEELDDDILGEQGENNY